MQLQNYKQLYRISLQGMTAALFTFVFSSSVSANPIECRQGEQTRSVEIVYAHPGEAVPCEVIYSKPAEGTIEMLWQAMNEAGYCEARVAEFVSKLESMGWQCSKATESIPD